MLTRACFTGSLVRAAAAETGKHARLVLKMAGSSDQLDRNVLERITAMCRHDVQRMGLSATIGNPEQIARWLAGTSKRRSVEGGRSWTPAPR